MKKIIYILIFILAFAFTSCDNGTYIMRYHPETESEYSSAKYSVFDGTSIVYIFDYQIDGVYYAIRSKTSKLFDENQHNIELDWIRAGLIYDKEKHGYHRIKIDYDDNYKNVIFREQHIIDYEIKSENKCVIPYKIALDLFEAVNKDKTSDLFIYSYRKVKTEI